MRGGGVRLDGVPADDPAMAWDAPGPVVLSVGVRKFVRVLPAR
jgi:hypothetical protein